MKHFLFVATMLFVIASTALTASGRLGEAIALYHEARYTEALSVLDALEVGAEVQPLDAADRDAIDQYRALCLLALERPAEARAILRRLIERRPEHPFLAEDLPPRFVAVARETQAQVLPDLVRTEYRLGKAGYDRREYGEAERRFRRVVSLADSAALSPAVREALEDLLELSTGFLGLIESRKLDTVALLPPAAFGHPASAPNALYTPADQLVRAPVALKQEAPPFRLRVGGSAIAPPASTGLLEVVIDESGRVEAARLSRGIHPVYDAQLLAAARRWEYTPATKDGKPVRYRKVIEIRVTSDASGR